MLWLVMFLVRAGSEGCLSTGQSSRTSPRIGPSVGQRSGERKTGEMRTGETRGQGNSIGSGRAARSGAPAKSSPALLESREHFGTRCTLHPRLWNSKGGGTSRASAEEIPCLEDFKGRETKQSEEGETGQPHHELKESRSFEADSTFGDLSVLISSEPVAGRHPNINAMHCRSIREGRNKHGDQGTAHTTERSQASAFQKWFERDSLSAETHEPSGSQMLRVFLDTHLPHTPEGQGRGAKQNFTQTFTQSVAGCLRRSQALPREGVLPVQANCGAGR